MHIRVCVCVFTACVSVQLRNRKTERFSVWKTDMELSYSCHWAGIRMYKHYAHFCLCKHAAGPCVFHVCVCVCFCTRQCVWKRLVHTAELLLWYGNNCCAWLLSPLLGSGRLASQGGGTHTCSVVPTGIHIKTYACMQMCTQRYCTCACRQMHAYIKRRFQRLLMQD